MKAETRVDCRRCLSCLTDSARRDANRRGFTLIEMLTTVAVLIIVLGLMVSLARFVRNRSAQQLTLTQLKDLETVLGQYMRHTGGVLPPVEPILKPDAPAALDETALSEAARRNNQQWVLALRTEYRLRQVDPIAAPDPFDQNPISVYDRRTPTLRDAWGSPIVLMPGQHQLIGLAPALGGKDRSFFFSAGPDRKYLTREDNLYSYEAFHAAAEP